MAFPHPASRGNRMVEPPPGNRPCVFSSWPNGTSALAGVMTRVVGERHLEYVLTDQGAALWPVVLSMMSWGDDFCATGGPRRLFRHAADGGPVDRWGRCDACG